MSSEVPESDPEPKPPVERTTGSAVSSFSEACGLIREMINKGWGHTLRLLVITIPFIVLLTGFILFTLVRAGWLSFTPDRDADRP